ncbi:CD209 antigen-like [Micropterus dolomieu]|uniref:CD209 antigen-like n=1 Tax=Micropterus dolomieu TaxID=147949 RepID=UPI001E8E78A6|nr:CD209 antigen-like [Micropterus dolomieu]
MTVPSWLFATISNQSEKELKENQTTILALNHNLTQLNNKLSSEKENLRRDHINLTEQLDNLTQDYTVLISKIANLSAENKNLTSQITKLSAEYQNLTSQITKLSAEYQNLTSQITKLSAEYQNLTSQNQQLETTENELNVSRAQWSIDAFCPKSKNQKRVCKACQDGWLHSQSSCYAINNPNDSGQKTWEKARENCRGKSSDLAVIVDETEKTFISNNSWGSSGTNGYWIGLRAEDGKWKWVNGSDPTENSWIQQPATNGQCVISVEKEGWKSVNCCDKNFWICKKKALSL